jgi:hypothetical protein
VPSTKSSSLLQQGEACPFDGAARDFIGGFKLPSTKSSSSLPYFDAVAPFDDLAPFDDPTLFDDPVLLDDPTPLNDPAYGVGMLFRKITYIYL